MFIFKVSDVNRRKKEQIRLILCNKIYGTRFQLDLFLIDHKIDLLTR
jgi:hypothetical protein